ncbi:hypothetical protein ACFQX4_15870 [Roseomonas sp. GCM10028921]
MPILSRDSEDAAPAGAAARRLRPGLPVLFATGYAAGNALEAERAAGCVVEQPFRLADLAATVRGCLGKGGGA